MDNPFIFALLLASVVIVGILWRIRTRRAGRSEVENEIIARRLARALKRAPAPVDTAVHARRATAYVQQAEPRRAIEDLDEAIGAMSREAYTRKPAAGGLDLQRAAINHEVTSVILIGLIGLIASASVVFNLPNAIQGSVVFAARMAVGLLGLAAALLLWLQPRNGWYLARAWALVQIPVVAWNSEGSPTAQVFSLELAFSSEGATAQDGFFKVGVNLAGVIFTGWLARWRERFQLDSSLDLPVAAATGRGANLGKKLFLLAGVLATVAIIAFAFSLINAALLVPSAEQYGDEVIPRVFGSWDYQALVKESDRTLLNTYTPDTERTVGQIKSRLGIMKTYQGLKNYSVVTNVGGPWAGPLYAQSMVHSTATLYADVIYDLSTASIVVELIHYPFESGWKIAGWNVSSPALQDLTQ